MHSQQNYIYLGTVNQAFRNSKEKFTEKLELFHFQQQKDSTMIRISASKVLPKNLKCLSKVAPTKMSAVEQKWHCTDRHGQETQAETKIETTSRNTKCIQVFLANFLPNFMLSSFMSHIYCLAAKLLQDSGSVFQFWYYFRQGFHTN